MSHLRNSINDPRFSRVFYLPADPASGRTSAFKVTYADYGYRNDTHPEKESVFLFFGSLMGSRLMHVAKDDLAKKHKIRIINADRPGIGGTDSAGASHGTALWSRAISALLAHLDIQHVSIGCHSGGTVYALDLLLHHPEILHREKPYLAIGAPWILPSHTNSTALQIVKALPAPIIGQADKLARTIQFYIGPLIGRSLGFSLALMAKFSSASIRAADPEREEADESGWEERLHGAIIDRIYAEGIEGISSDAILFMQKQTSSEPAGWGNWGDYDTLAPRLAEALVAVGRRLRVDVFYAEQDSLIGNGWSKGALWFDQCWRDQRCRNNFDYRSTTIKDADHDGVWDLNRDAVHQVFAHIGEQANEGNHVQ